MTPEEMKATLLNLKVDRIILVAQTHVSGTKQNWWKVYQDFFETNMVKWKSLEEFAANPVVLPFNKIPINTEVKYMTPNPKIPLEQEPDIAF